MIKKVVILLFLLVVFMSPVSAQWYLDNYKYSSNLTLTGVDSQDLIRVNVGSGGNLTSFYNAIVKDGNAVAFVDCDTNVLLPHSKLYYNSDKNAGFDLNVGLSNTCVQIRYGSEIVLSDQTDNHHTYDIFDDFEDGNFLGGLATWTEEDGSWAINNGDLNLVTPDGSGIGSIYSDLNSSRDFSNGFLYHLLYTSCDNCATGISTETKPFNEAAGGGTGDGYHTYRGPGENNNLDIYRRDNGVGTSLDNGTLNDWDYPKLIRFARDENDVFYGYNELNITSIVSATDSTYTSGRYVYLGQTNTGGIGAEEFRFSYHYDLDNTQNFGAEQDQNSTFYFLKVVNEETSNALQATVSINDTNTLVDENGFFTVNTGLFTFPLTINVSNSGYDTRNFFYDKQEALNYDSTVGLRTANESKDINFQFFAPDESTKLSNRYVSVYYNGSIVSGRNKTDSDGKVTLNLAPQDSSYDFNVFVSGSDFGDTNVEYSYDTATITVNHPKDESTNSNISSPSGFNFDIGGVGSQTINDQTSFPFSTIVILGNTSEFYTTKVVDSNSDGQQYYARYYNIKVKGSTTNYILQPYLISLDDGVLTNFIVKDKLSSSRLSGLSLKMNRSIDQNSQTVEEKLTNAAGIAQFVFLAQTSYFLTITDPNTDIIYFPTGTGSGEYTSAQSSYTIEISFTSGDANTTDYSIDVSIFPETDSLSGTSQLIDVNVTSNYASRIVSQILDSNVVQLQSDVSDVNSNNTFSINPQDYNNLVTVKVIVYSDRFTQTYTKVYSIVTNTSGVLAGIQGTRTNFGLIGGLILTILGTLLVLQAYGTNLAGDNESQLFVMLIVLSIFSIMFFYEENANPLIDPMIPLYATIFFGIIAWWYKKG